MAQDSGRPEYNMYPYTLELRTGTKRAYRGGVFRRGWGTETCQTIPICGVCFLPSQVVIIGWHRLCQWYDLEVPFFPCHDMGMDVERVQN